MAVFRSPLNPIIKPEDIKPSRPDFEVVCAFNAGVARLDDEIILLLRIAEKPIYSNLETRLFSAYDTKTGAVVNIEVGHDDIGIDFSDPRMIKTPEGLFLTSISHLRVARSKDGLHFDIDENPALYPTNEYEMYGIEDPRITKMGETYYINYSAISSMGVTTCLAATKDFRSYERLGTIFCPDNKDVAIFPDKVDGKYYALHRPSSANFGTNDIWIAESHNLLYWGKHRFLMGRRELCWDDGRVGASAVPFRIAEGWLEIYHGATKNNRYCLGAVLLDADEPWKVIARTDKPIIEPEIDYEINGFFGNVIFNCGVLYEDNVVKLYYGAADTYMCYAEIPIGYIRELLSIDSRALINAQKK